MLVEGLIYSCVYPVEQQMQVNTFDLMKKQSLQLRPMLRCGKY